MIVKICMLSSAPRLFLPRLNLEFTAQWKANTQIYVYLKKCIYKKKLEWMNRWWLNCSNHCERGWTWKCVRNAQTLTLKYLRYTSCTPLETYRLLSSNISRHNKVTQKMSPVSHRQETSSRCCGTFWFQVMWPTKHFRGDVLNCILVLKQLLF